ncbi:hypothetical protein GF380_03870 [Candidatus Uhrbacteria bacterium]|nr:hypothetical protein [Candidatus Uhrbacteria bacterium]MBD3284231.1 hypothetical protein [Candidatus Uhrbacteria bacterium]
MNPLRKIVSSFVTVTTVLWSMGGALLFPSVAQAATLSPGDLIKASGPAVYYYAADGKRYVFPNEKTYFSWYSDFSSVMTITDAELAAIMIGGNVTIRPGTKLVKITTDPKTYAVSTRCGMLHWIETETIAQDLYGSDWNQRIVDVPDAFFVDYTVGASLSTSEHPDGQIIHYAADPDTYYVVMNGMKRMLTSDGISANMLDTSNAVVTDITYPDGVDVVGMETELGTVACESATPSVSGGVSVTLASDTPAGKTVPRNSSSNALVKVNLAAGNEAARVNGLRFKRVGTGAASDISNVYLYDSNMVRLTTGRTINSTTHLVEFNSLDLDIPANSTKSVYIYADFAVTSGSEGGEHAIQIADAASVIIEGTGSVNGNFPITGNTFTVGAVAAARVEVNKGVTPTNPTVGQKNAEISNFKLTANTNDVEVRQINLYQAGSINNSDLRNIELVQGTTVVATASEISDDNLITLVFDPPFTITNGVSKVFSLRADIEGRADRTIKTYVEYTTDVTAIDKVFNAGAAICIDSAQTGGCTAASQGSFDGGGTDYIEVTTQGGQLTVSYNGPAASNVAKGTLAVPMYDFSITSEDSELEIRNLRFTLSGTGCSVGNCKVKGSSGTEYFRNIRLVDTDTGETVMGPVNMASTVASPATTTGQITFTDSWNLDAGTTRNLQIQADLSNSEDVANEFFGTGQAEYTVTLNAFQSNDIRVADTGEFLNTSDIVPNSDVVGNAQTVKAASLSVELATDPTGTTIVKKQQNVPSVGLTLSAGQQSDVTVTSIKLTGKAQTAMVPGYTAAKFDQLVIKLSLWDGDTQLGTSEVPSSGEAQITNFQLDIPKGTTKNLTVKATVASTVSSSTSTDQYAIGIASADDVTAQDDEANTVTPTVSSDLTSNAGTSGQNVVMSVRKSGAITYQEDNHPSATILVGGGSAWKVMARYRATAQYESVTVDRVRVQHPNDGGTNGDFTQVAIASDGDTTNRWDILSAGTTGTKDIDLSQNKITVPKDGTVDFEIWAKLAAPVATSSATTFSPRTGDTPSLGVATDTQTGEWNANYSGKINIRATGDASGERLYESAKDGLVGDAQVLRKAKPVVTKLSSSSSLSSGSPADLYKFQINADADGGSVSWMQLMFTVATTSGVTSLNQFEFFKGATELQANTEVYIRDTAGTDLTGSTSLNASSGSAQVIVRLVAEETVGAGGTTYTLRATPSLSSGSVREVTTSFYRPAQSVVTGYIADDGGPNAWVGALGIDTAVGGSDDGTSNATGTFLWSDNTDVPHSYASGSNGGSRDWTNDVYVENMNDSNTVEQN